MSIYKIYKNGEEINRIIADEVFCQEHYNTDGYTYEYEGEDKTQVNEQQLRDGIMNILDQI